MTDLGANATPSSDRLDAATSARLARLRAIGVDPSSLLGEVKKRVGARPVAAPVAPPPPTTAKSVASQPPPRAKASDKAASAKPKPAKAVSRKLAATAKAAPIHERPPVDPARLYRLRRFRMAAASAILLISLFVSLRVWSSRAIAPSMTFIASVHDDLIATRVAVNKVDSVEAANAALGEQSVPAIPELTGLARVSGCTTRDMQGKHLACLMLKDSAGWPVTLVVADASDIRVMDDASTKQFNGRSYQVHTVDGLTIVSAVRDGKWICFISAAPEQRLLQLASQSKL